MAADAVGSTAGAGAIRTMPPAGADEDADPTNAPSGEASPTAAHAGDFDDESGSERDHAVFGDADSDPEPLSAGTGSDADGVLPDASTRRLLARLGVLVANCDEETADYLGRLRGPVAVGQGLRARPARTRRRPCRPLPTDRRAACRPGHRPARQRVRGDHLGAVHRRVHEAPPRPAIPDWAFTPVPGGAVTTRT